MVFVIDKLVGVNVKLYVEYLLILLLDTSAVQDNAQLSNQQY
jgi:hypothetical protein